jgi:hypothetical protein
MSGWPQAPEHDDRPGVALLLANIKRDLESLEALVYDDRHWRYEDPIYRFYHQSSKVFYIQGETQQLVEALQRLSPDGAPLNVWFTEIVAQGMGKKFVPADNDRWLERTRPMLEAFFHARFFAEMAVKYGRELERPPAVLPSGWAALLYLFDLR